MNDTINACFESLGCLFILPSIIRLHREKEVRGISWVHAAFFWVWGAWNIYYYPSLDQWYSFIGGIGIFIANTVWMAQLLYWSRK